MKTLIVILNLILMLGCSDPYTQSDITTTTVYETTLYDDFSYNDQTIWQKADWSNGTPFYNSWGKEQVKFDNGTLNILLKQKDLHSKTHVSGEYRTYNTYKYGKYTTKFQASDVNGTISSFFIYTGLHEGTEWDEIDIEILGKDPTKMQINYWRNGHEHPVMIDLGFNASSSMHTYSFTWHKDYIKWYVDDKLVYIVNENHLNDNDSLPINPGKIMISLWAATGIDSWSGSYENNTTAKAHYDYIKYEAFK